MAIQTYTEQLEEVQASISGILSGGKTITFNGRSVSFGDLDTLYAAEQRLRRMVSKETRGGIRVRGATPVNNR